MSLTPSVEAERAADARFEQLLKDYRAFVRGTIRRVCPPELGLSCDDIEQEAWFSLWKALRSEREIVSLTSYIRKVAVTTTLHAIRRAAARREEALPDDNDENGASSAGLLDTSGPSPHTLAEREELRQKIASELGRLAENRRLAVGLHLRDLNSRQIGNLLGWSEAKARNLVSRGRQDLQRALRAIGIDYVL